MAFLVRQQAWDLFPGMSLVVARGKGINNNGPRPEIEKMLRDAQQQLRSTWSYLAPDQDPRINPWRRAFQQTLGLPHKKFTSAIENLCRLALREEGLRSISPLVDLGNALSVRFKVPLGIWDTDDLFGGDLVLRLTDGGERFTELGKWSPAEVGPGELCYMDTEEVVTRHFVWRQSETAKVTAQTRNFFFVSEVLAEVGPAVAAEVRDAAVAALQCHFGVEVRSSILSAPCDRWEWD
jgi:DNA/RNA-binding domain of Phe-tRNA-synthetase-like protein